MLVKNNFDTVKRGLPSLRYFSLVLMVFFVFYGATLATEGVKLGKTVDFVLTSKLLQRDVSYRVILPYKYKQKDAKTRYPVVYLLHGLAGHFDNWTSNTRIAEYSAQYRAIFVMPEGGDGWYSDSVTTANDKFESYIIQELIPEIDAKFQTLAIREGRAIAGLSMGGYGALKFAIRYPDMFFAAGSFSGALDAPLRGKLHPFLRPSIVSVFGADENPSHQYNDIFGLIGSVLPENGSRLPFFYLDCGTNDFLIQANRDFSALLLTLKIPHEFRELPGQHEWKYWDSQVSEFLGICERHSTVFLRR